MIILFAFTIAYCGHEKMSLAGLIFHFRVREKDFLVD